MTDIEWLRESLKVEERARKTLVEDIKSLNARFEAVKADWRSATETAGDLARDLHHATAEWQEEKKRAREAEIEADRWRQAVIAANKISQRFSDENEDLKKKLAKKRLWSNIYRKAVRWWRAEARSRGCLLPVAFYRRMDERKKR